MWRIIFGIHMEYETVISNVTTNSMFCLFCLLWSSLLEVNTILKMKRVTFCEHPIYCSFRLSYPHKWVSNCNQLVLFPQAWKYKHTCSMWSEGGWVWLSVESRQAFSPLLSGASVRSATVLSNKPALPTGRVSCLKAPFPNNTVTLKRKKREN